MSFMVRVCSRELLAEACVMVGGQNIKFDRAQLRNSRDGTISIIFEMSQESIKALSMDTGVKMSTFSATPLMDMEGDGKTYNTTSHNQHASSSVAKQSHTPDERQPLLPPEAPTIKTRASTWQSMCEALAVWKF